MTVAGTFVVIRFKVYFDIVILPLYFPSTGNRMFCTL